MNWVSLLRTSIYAEGISYLVLLFIAMPMKYFFGMPLAVRIVGGLHGFLFLAFLLFLFRAHIGKNWTMRQSGSLFAASLIPGSFFWMDRRVRING